MIQLNEIKLCVIGLGYVGLPLAVTFASLREVVAFDVNTKRIENLQNYIDLTLEVPSEDIKKVKDKIIFTSDETSLKKCNCFIVTVPTPVSEDKQPDLSYLISASELVGRYLERGGLAIYESTVFPGATEEVCVPLLEKNSGLTINKDFFVGYSPERINPGDKKRSIRDIVKVVSGSTSSSAELIQSLYDEVIDAGTFLAANIKVAEAAKVIENTQRDINIALMNELSIIFHKIGIETRDVLAAARTKWNFLDFVPGLVGGHCIGVDPYYLTYKAKEIGYLPNIILGGRELNDSMGRYIVSRVMELMSQRSLEAKNSSVLILGLTFKENCPDTRNSRVIDVIDCLKSEGCKVEAFDPWVSEDVTKADFGCEVPRALQKNRLQLEKGFAKCEGFDVVILSVGHDIFRDLGFDTISRVVNENNIIFDIKGLFEHAEFGNRL